MHRKYQGKKCLWKKYCKKSLAIVLALSMSISLYPVQKTSAAESAQKTNTSDEENQEEVKYERIDISTAEDFVKFAEECDIDAWSKNKYVSLKADIDLTGVEFQTIPVFNGIFDGVGHTISGFEYIGSGYVVGLFRYIESNGVVENLTLKGNITSENEKECIGSICGINYGTIRNCTFQGTVSGRDTVGGIVGINENTGTLSGCSVKGRITGYYSTGGIAGINHGVINYCTNRAGINDDSAWVEEDDEMGGMEIIKNLTADDESELYSGVDTGGITGFSDGVISRCTNSGTVGYEHTGYNIGGIAGRQSGIVSLSTNNGIVYGRKDVGGIVGQMEPFIEVDEAESLRDAINKLHDAIEKTINDMDAAADVVKSDVDTMQSYADDAIDTGDELLSRLTDFTDDNIGQGNSITERMEHVIDLMPDILNNVSAADDAVSKLNDEIKQLNEDLEILDKVDGSAYNETDYNRISLLSTVGGTLMTNSINPEENSEVTITVKPENNYQLNGELIVTDADNNRVVVEQAAGSDNEYTFTMPKKNVKVTAGFIYDENASVSQTPVIILSSNLSGNAQYSIDDANKKVTINVIPSAVYTVESIEVTDESQNKMAVAKKQSGSYIYEFDINNNTSTKYNVAIKFQKQDKKQAIDTAKSDINSDIDALNEASQDVQNSVNIIRDIIMPNGSYQDWNSLSKDDKDKVEEEILNLADALSEMSLSASSVLSSFATIYNILSPYASDASDAAKKDLDKATDHVQSMTDALKAANNGVRGIVNYLNAQSDIRFAALGDEFDNTKESFHNQLKGLSESIKSLSDNASDYTDIINNDLREVNDQINVVLNLLADRMTDAEQLSMDVLYEEVDDEEIESITTGRTDACNNKGVIKGDINVGGIAGSMSIDDEDLEDSAAGSVEYAIGRRFITKCLITDSVNEGYVTSKKDGAGGICGYMDHGIIVDSESYGSVESTEGGYVGGICGESFTIIKRCYALCSVSGNQNVGGIAGYAESLKNCYSMSDVHAENGRVGAIAGQIASYEIADAQAEEEPKVAENYYVGDDICGIDNISYIGIAEPISYNDLLMVEQLPVQFWHLKVIYKIEDTYLGSEEIEYGTVLNHLNYPQIPKKEGFYGVWQDVSDKKMIGTVVVEAEYKENVTVVQSNMNDISTEEGSRQKPFALVENIFTEDTILNAVISDMTPPEQAEGSQNVIYEVTLANSGMKETDSFALRVLNPYEDAVVYGYQDGSWIELESKARGQYLQVVMTGTQEYFCVMEKPSRLMIIVLSVSAAAVILILLVVLVKKVRSRRKQRQDQKNQGKADSGEL